jgi:hypothetical protein
MTSRIPSRDDNAHLRARHRLPGHRRRRHRHRRRRARRAGLRREVEHEPGSGDPVMSTIAPVTRGRNDMIILAAMASRRASSRPCWSAPIVSRLDACRMDRGVFTVAGGPRRVQGRWQEFREPRGVNVRGRPSRGTKRPGKPGPFVIVRGCSWPWAQGVAGSNPVAPTKFLIDQRKHLRSNDFAARALSRPIRRGSPSQASFRRRLVPDLAAGAGWRLDGFRTSSSTSNWEVASVRRGGTSWRSVTTSSNVPRSSASP